MKLDDARRPSNRMQAIDVLRHDGQLLIGAEPAFGFSDGQMPRVWLGTRNLPSNVGKEPPHPSWIRRDGSCGGVARYINGVPKPSDTTIRWQP